VTDDGAALGAAAAEFLAGAGRGPIKPGLTGAEFAAIEAEFGFTFADDHRAFLAAGLPAGRRWVDWRDGNRDELRERLAWPVEGVLFDVEQTDFWYAGWGPRPDDTVQAVATARALLLTAPRLVPVYSHRFLPAGHGASGHPVLSVMQTDVVCYGADLLDYLKAEFGTTGPSTTPCRSTVDFWSRLVAD
jgi:hypothetical protein